MEENKKRTKTASKTVKNDEAKKAKEETFNKNHSDDLNKGHGERIKNNVEDGENFTGI